MTGTEYLREVARARTDGRVLGVYSVCSANRFVIEAAMQQAKVDESALLIESTSNQVNQFGGYTRMTPSDFASYVREVASGVAFPAERIILGGDHLGPHPWQRGHKTKLVEFSLPAISLPSALPAGPAPRGAAGRRHQQQRPPRPPSPQPGRPRSLGLAHSECPTTAESSRAAP